MDALEDAARTLSDPGADAATLAADVCGDMERELAALEKRLAFFRSLKSAASAVPSPPKPQDERRPPRSPLTGNESSVEGRNRGQAAKAKQQQAGQVVDEVENVLQNCDRLLEHARAIGTSVSSTFI
jgi:hypothetical protein